jgi:hypothetical protein
VHEDSSLHDVAGNVRKYWKFLFLLWQAISPITAIHPSIAL